MNRRFFLNAPDVVNGRTPAPARRRGPAALMVASLCSGIALASLASPDALARSRHAAAAAPTPGGAYGRALIRFRAGDLAGALSLLENAPSGADVHNLRGAIFLRQKRFDQARAEFSAAAALDSSLWEAGYNQAETDLRQGRYAESRREFAALLSRADTAAEREFLRYKILLAGMLDGQEEPVQRYFAEVEKHRSARRPAAYFYLHAALAHQHGHTAEGEHWLAQAPATSSRPAGRVYADSFRALGWAAPRLAAHASGGGGERRSTSATAPARVAVVEFHQPPATPGASAASDGRDPSSSSVSFRLGAAPSSAVDDHAPLLLAAAAPPSRPPSGSSSSSAARAAATPSPAPKPAPVPSEAFNTKYESAYRAYAQRDFASALRFLDEAEEAQAGLADGANLRGLVYSRQRRFDEADAAFRKAVAADPTFWAAKFNLAELPFGYKNYTEARKRFESLFAETDPKTQPREAELTEFKVFLTLLLEGKESAARNFLSRFKPDGATPARFYALAALDFHDGKFDRAVESVNAAKKAYPAPLEAIFAESFYRIGWLTDANAPVAAAASPTPESTPTPAPTVDEAATPAPAETPVVAAATPSVAPESTPTPAVAVAADSPTVPPPEPSPAVALAPSPVPTAALPTPVPDALTPQITPAPVAVDSPAPEPAAEAQSSADRAIRVGVPIAVLLYVIGTTILMVRAVARVRRGKSRARRTSYRSADIAADSKV